MQRQQHSTRGSSKKAVWLLFQFGKRLFSGRQASVAKKHACYTILSIFTRKQASPACMECLHFSNLTCVQRLQLYAQFGVSTTLISGTYFQENIHWTELWKEHKPICSINTYIDCKLLEGRGLVCLKFFYKVPRYIDGAVSIIAGWESQNVPLSKTQMRTCTCMQGVRRGLTSIFWRCSTELGYMALKDLSNARCSCKWFLYVPLDFMAGFPMWCSIHV